MISEAVKRSIRSEGRKGLRRMQSGEGGSVGCLCVCVCLSAYVFECVCVCVCALIHNMCACGWAFGHALRVDGNSSKGT